MKRTDKPTDYILVRAYTDSKWDSCDFAIINISEEWKRQQAKSLSALEHIKNDENFLSISFRDTSINFYKERQLKLNEEPIPNLKELLGDTDWTFVELEKDESNQFSMPESDFNVYKLNIDKCSDFRYIVNAKNTDDIYWTAEIKLTDIIK